MNSGTPKQYFTSISQHAFRNSFFFLATPMTLESSRGQRSNQGQRQILNSLSHTGTLT